MLVRLRQTGNLLPFKGSYSSDTDDLIERDALIVYEGHFESAEGPVEVTRDEIVKLADAHNLYIASKQVEFEGSESIGYYPPLQVDHSTSGWDTVGRVVGNVRAEVCMIDGQERMGLYGTLRVLGAENVRRVKDGRWAELSVGAFFDISKLSEVSFVPFPAAKGSSILKQGNSTDNKEVQDVDKEKLKKHLMKTKKLSAEDADKEIERLSADEHKDELSKLSSEAEEADKLSSDDDKKDDDDKKELSEDDDKKDDEDKKDDLKKKLSAFTAKATKLSTDFRAHAATARLAAKKGHIQVRLSKLRSEAKVTPAEIKKMDLVKLAASSDEVIEATLNSFNNRQPVVQIGQLGSSRETSFGEAGKQSRLSALETRLKSKMSLFAGSEGKKTNLEGAVDVYDQTGLAPSGGVSFQDEVKKIFLMIDQGNGEGAKNAIQELVVKLAGGIEIAENSNELGGHEEHLTALSKAVDKMSEEHEQVLKLVASLTE